MGRLIRPFERSLLRPWADHLPSAVTAWFVARVAVAIGFVAALAVADELVPGERPVQLDQGLMAWDGAWYAAIAEDGYEATGVESVRFFPLLPLLARVLAFALFGSEAAALVLVANVAALALGVLLHRLARRETGDIRLAGRAAWLVAVFPPAMVLVLGYAESLAMLLAVVAFLALRRGSWWGAAAAGVLAGLCRPVGVLLAVPAAVEAARGFGAASWPDRGARAAAVGAPLAGAGAYLAWVGIRFGDATLPLRAHEAADLRGSYVLPPVRIVQAVVDLFTGEALGAGLHVPFIALFAVLLVVSFRRWPACYGAYAASVLVVALSAESLGSFERYGLSAFPLLLALATISDRTPVERIVLIGCGAGLTAFTTLVMLGVFVP